MKAGTDPLENAVAQLSAAFFGRPSTFSGKGHRQSKRKREDSGLPLGEDFGNVYYLAPDMTEWESLGKGYTDFLHWTFAGELAKFYEGQRWESWQADVTGLAGDKAFMFYPFFWAEGPEIGKRQRSSIPVRELWDLHLANR